jgi:hypothetical protein
MTAPSPPILSNSVAGLAGTPAGALPLPSTINTMTRNGEKTNNKGNISSISISFLFIRSND